VFRTIPIGGDRRVELRVEANNVLNHGVYANPSANVTAGDFGRITSLLGGAGLANGAYPERQVRLGLRFQF